MKIAIFSKQPEASELEVVAQILEEFQKMHITPLLSSDFFKYFQSSISHSYFKDANELEAQNPDFLIAVGGDGTVLNTLLYVKDLNIPVLGINTGRLGFLANVKPNYLQEAIQNLVKHQFTLEERTILELDADQQVFEGNCWSLNDFSIHKRDTSSMITIETYLNGEPFNTYWADGLLVATPTGSTAYSLSCGGPVLFPDSSGFVITPVAPHNLNVRPVVVSDCSEISFKVSGRGANFLIALDSRNEQVDYEIGLSIKKANFSLKFVRLPQHHFVHTLQEKLNWGKDNRNLPE